MRSGLVLAANTACLVLARLVFSCSVASVAWACVSGSKSPSDCVLGSLQQLVFEEACSQAWDCLSCCDFTIVWLVSASEIHNFCKEMQTAK